MNALPPTVLHTALIVGLAAVAACAPLPRPAAPPQHPQVQHPQPMPVQPRPVMPTRSDTWIDQPQTAGTWRWAMTQGKSTATFGGGEFAMVCDRAANAVTLVQSGTSPTQTVQMTIRASSESRVLSAVRASDGSTTLIATLSARDSLLDAMAFSRGRFAVETAGLTPLYLPSWTEVSRVIEDCR